MLDGFRILFCREMLPLIDHRLQTRTALKPAVYPGRCSSFVFGQCGSPLALRDQQMAGFARMVSSSSVAQEGIFDTLNRFWHCSLFLGSYWTTGFRAPMFQSLKLPCAADFPTCFEKAIEPCLAKARRAELKTPWKPEINAKVKLKA